MPLPTSATRMPLSPWKRTPAISTASSARKLLAVTRLRKLLHEERPIRSIERTPRCR